MVQLRIKIMLIVISAILFLAFLVTGAPTGDPEPCPLPHQGIWPNCH